MGKYDPLQSWLSQHGGARTTLSFDEIERLIGASLPDTACNLREWWGNNADGHPQARAWLDAGYRVDHVDALGRTVRFVRG
ncbi:MAG: hypothetical protein DHS20C14_22870 [Phycisphaeraceae bacterium]|nr:MAG: hypothetical protein DHS20C14_22870 [Phycisphaeraceae bacterium]